MAEGSKFFPKWPCAVKKWPRVDWPLQDGSSRQQIRVGDGRASEGLWGRHRSHLTGCLLFQHLCRAMALQRKQEVRCPCQAPLPLLLFSVLCPCEYKLLPLHACLSVCHSSCLVSSRMKLKGPMKRLLEKRHTACGDSAACCGVDMES